MMEITMPTEVIAFLLTYAIGSFLLTALFVRLEERSALAVMVRRHFYCFPFMPPILLGWGLVHGMSRAVRAVDAFLRYCFEILSGRKTYRRQKIDQYYND
ncbi:MAG: hypothetical protein KBT59_06520 [Sphingomonadales bacterium]|nr:hypothetical protein [Sphingomonadales bacterium]